MASQVIAEEKGEVLKVGNPMAHPRTHRHSTNLDRGRSRSRERAMYYESELETTRRDIEWLMEKERLRDSLGERTRDFPGAYPVRDRSRERRLEVERHLELEGDGHRRSRRNYHHIEREGDPDQSRRIVVLERQPDERFRRSGRDSWIEVRPEANEFRRGDRPRMWSTEYDSPPPRPVILDSHRAASPYNDPGHLLSDAELSVNRDMHRDDIRRSSFVRERRLLTVPSIPRSRPRSAFATPYPADEVYYVGPSERDREIRSRPRSDTLTRPASSIVLLERERRPYQDREPSVERYRYSSPTIALQPMPPSRSRVPPATRAPSPVKTAPSPAPAAVEPTAAEKPTEDIEMREKLLTFLCPYSPNLVHHNLAKARAKDSGAWLFSLPTFEKWLKTKAADDADATEGNRSNCLWLSGNVGAGKTMLMSAVIDHLLASVETLSEDKRKKTAVLCYYFDRNLSCSPRDVIASLLRQLCSQKDVGPLPWFLADNMASMKKASGSKGNTSNEVTTDSEEQYPAPVPIGDMIADFLSLQPRFDSVYICLDGLEECDDLVALFELLVRLTAPSSPSRLAISARPRIAQSGITANIGGKDMIIDLEQHNASDIRYYLETYTKNHACLVDMIGGEALQEHVRLVAERSGGNFLAATVEAVGLNRLTSKFDIKKHVDRSSTGFTELFSHIWFRLDDQPPLHATLAKRIFYWLSVSRRALTLKELQQAVAIEPGESRASQMLEQEERFPPPSLIEKVCMGFVRIDTDNDMFFTNPSALPFYFYQFNASFSAEARKYAAECCVEFLNSEILSKGAFKSQNEFDQVDQKLPFLRYVSLYWGTHLEDFKEGDMPEIAEGLIGNVPLMDTMSQLLHVNRAAAGKQRRYDEFPSGFGGLHFGAYFRLGAAFRKWTSPQCWAHPKDSWGRKPLHVASTSPSQYVRHVLYNACNDDTFGFIVSATEPPDDERSPTPNTEKEPQVTDKNEDTKKNSKGFRGELVPILPWTWNWVGDVIERLKIQVPFIREEMNILDNRGKTPLHHFIVEWSEDRFDHILDTVFDLQRTLDEDSDVGSDSDAKNVESCPGTGSGTDDAGPDANSNEVDLLPSVADQDGRTILDYACQRNVVCVTQVFTASRWSPEHISRAIVAAATGGHVWPLKRLLELVELKLGTETSNLDLNAAVIEASRRGFTDIVRMLRQQGADLSKPEKGKQGMTALHYAAYGSHLETVRYLLLEGADPNHLDELGKSPLFCASESGNKGIVSLLIEKGANPNAVNSEGFSSLQLAARNGILELVKMLLRFSEGGDRAARPSSFSNPGVESKSPLLFAAENGHNEVIQLLLDEGLPRDSKDSEGRTMLSYACQHGHVQTVKLLLARKIDVNARDSTGRTPLSYAAAGGHVDVVAVLMGQSELDPNVVDTESKSALIYAAQNGHGSVVMLLAVLNTEAEDRASIIRTTGGVLSKLLKPSGCRRLINLEHADKEGHTAQYYLRQTGNGKAIEFLDAMNAYKSREKLQQPGVDQRQGPDVVVADDGSDGATAKRDTGVSEKTTPPTGVEIPEGVGAGLGNLGAVVMVDKTGLTPVAEESEDALGESGTNGLEPADKGGESSNPTEP
ncbi:hypothetical protein GGR54DRAFT_73026 [Hypoxylon sp. NC1633]|nr:hypothetical protein GGR54DRAFT_73026 [Hypoxylon sp. NC1633]